MIKLIENIVCQGEKVTPADLQVRTRKTKIKETRQIVMYFATEKKVSRSAAGRYYGLDHATVCHARKLVENLCFSDKDFALKICQYKLNIDESIKENDESVKEKRDHILQEFEEYKLLTA